MKRIAPSILSADLARLADEVREVIEAGADWIHVDVMDGHFVPNITIGPVVVNALKKVVSIPLDVHLMIENADFYLDAFIRAGADILTVQVEASTHLHRTVHAIKEKGVRAGVALNPATPLESLDYILPDLDLVMIMTVNPGFGGQEFIPAMLPKIERLKEIITKRKLNAEIEVDGGIKVDNIGEVARRGGDIFVGGSGIFGTPDRKETITRMRREIGK
ncbi:MAG: ribulose-phosphate 3-epimerase [Deltaproteobacteria bacterium RBG_13_52_11]|nr:MAG: ribulose-phosphate 3-epimerase [Deltaproteobacteria bacterium RBG_13_52_11]